MYQSKSKSAYVKYNNTILYKVNGKSGCFVAVSESVFICKSDKWGSPSSKQGNQYHGMIGWISYLKVTK